MSAPNILLEANEVVHGDRQNDYGHPFDNHTRTAKLWATYLGVEITPEQVCFLNMLQKISRSNKRLTRDTLVDIAGYAANVEMVQGEKLARRFAGVIERRLDREDANRALDEMDELVAGCKPDVAPTDPEGKQEVAPNGPWASEEDRFASTRAYQDAKILEEFKARYPDDGKGLSRSATPAEAEKFFHDMAAERDPDLCAGIDEDRRMKARFEEIGRQVSDIYSRPLPSLSHADLAPHTPYIPTTVQRHGGDIPVDPTPACCKRDTSTPNTVEKY